MNVLHDLVCRYDVEAFFEKGAVFERSNIHVKTPPPCDTGSGGIEIQSMDSPSGVLRAQKKIAISASHVE
nr:hypothetical protein [Immundisolibacter sp.]